MHQALPVVALRGDEEAFGEECSLPVDAMEYLVRVRAEAAKIPDIMVAESVATAVRPPEPERVALAPPTEWEVSVLADLSEARSCLEAYKARGVGSKRFPRVSVPSMRDARGWACFCFGSDAASNYEAEEDGSDSDDDAVTSSPVEPAAREKSIFFSSSSYRVPSVRLVLQFDSPMTQALLGHHVRWIEGKDGLSPEEAAWVYALLARVDFPLHRDTLALIRRLVRRLLQLRDNQTTHVASVMTLLVVAGRYFGQATPGELNGTEDPNSKPLASLLKTAAIDDEDDDDDSVDFS